MFVAPGQIGALRRRLLISVALPPVPAGLLLQETFDGATNTDITALTPAFGQGWARHPTSTDTTPLRVDDGGRLYAPAGGALYYNTSPAFADGYVEFDLYRRGSGGDARLGPAIRCSPTSATMYHVRWVEGSGLTLYRIVDGTLTSIGSYAMSIVLGESAKGRLTVSGAHVSVQVGGATVIEYTDPDPLPAGHIAFRSGGSQGATTGIHYDNVVAMALGIPAPMPTNWAIGLARTPSYVPAWTRPATIAEGKANGSIPVDAIEFEKGNNGGPFSADAAGWEAFMDACNAADKPGATQTPLLELTGVARKYLYRGLYGAGPQDVKIKRTDRATGTRTSLWMVWKNKPTIRGIDFDSHSGIIGVTYPRHRLAKLEKVNDIDTWVAHPNPYFTSTEPTQQSFGAISATFPVGQLGTIILTGNVSITGLSVVYQRASTVESGQPDPDGPRMTGKILDPDWYAECETVQLFAAGQAACTTHAQVRDAINAHSAVTKYRAELNDEGQVRLTHNGVDLPRAPDEINAAYSGSGSVSTYNRTPDFDMSHNTFTDCDQGYGAIMDALELGVVTICSNKCPGTWNLLSAPVLRWSALYAANNHWYDCMLTRPTAVGRTNSRLPRGSSLTARNTLLWLGNDSNARMRYHGAMGGNICLIENNKVENVESANDTDTVNAAVLADIRNAWQNTALGRIVRRAYNEVFHLVGVLGAIDCNVFYSKDRGGSYIANFMREFGAAYYDANRKGSEAAAILKKNPGSYYSTVAGVAAFGIPGNAAAPGGGAEPEPMVYRGNTMIDGPNGCCWLKSDEDGAYTIIEQNLFEGWENFKGGAEQTTGSGSGLVRVTTHQSGARINGNLFRRIVLGSFTKRLISLWNITAVGTHDGTRFMISGNQYQMDAGTVYTADTAMVTYNGTTVNSFRSNIRLGINPILAANGNETGLKFLVVEENNAVVNGTPIEAAPLYGTADFLAAYGSDPMPLAA